MAIVIDLAHDPAPAGERDAMTETKRPRGGYRGGGYGCAYRGIGWDTITAMRAEWQRMMTRLGFDGNEWMAVDGMTLRWMLADEGLPTQLALAKRYQLASPKVSMILRGKAYRLPVVEAEIAFGERMSALARERWAARRALGAT